MLRLQAGTTDLALLMILVFVIANNFTLLVPYVTHGMGSDWAKVTTASSVSATSDGWSWACLKTPANEMKRAYIA